MEFIDRKKFTIFVLIILGIFSLIIIIFITYNLSISNYNKKAYEIKEKLSNYPVPIIIFSKKQINELNTNDISKIELWLDNDHISKSKIKIRNNKIYLTVRTENKFILSKYISKIYMIPNIELKSLNFAILQKEINIILG